MKDLLEWLVTAEDSRQQAKVKHLMKDILAIVFFAELANASESEPGCFSEIAGGG